jgi:VWFA-related protein
MVKFASRTALRLFTVGLLLLGSGRVWGQDAPSPSITVTTRIVVLDVVVTDKKGALVQRTFDKSDFTIYEGGKPQTIRSFEPPSAHVMPGAGQAIVNSAADLTKIGDAPVTVLVLDELNSRFEDMSYSRQMLVKYLLSQPAVLKEPTLMLVATNTSFQQLHDYTQDRDALVQIVKKRVSQYSRSDERPKPASDDSRWVLS